MGGRDCAGNVLRALRQETITSERSWLFAVATNLVRDDARKQSRQRKHLELLRAEAEVAQANVEIEPTSMERDEERALARQAVESLVERDRLALLMREEGLDYDEIAAALEITRSSVGTTLSRARRRLAENFEALQRDKENEGHAAS